MKSDITVGVISGWIVPVLVMADGSPQATAFHKRPDAANVWDQIDQHHGPGLATVMPTLDLNGEVTPDARNHRN